jgi:hypothetical protein
MAENNYPSNLAPHKPARLRMPGRGKPRLWPAWAQKKKASAVAWKLSGVLVPLLEPRPGTKVNSQNPCKSDRVFKATRPTKQSYLFFLPFFLAFFFFLAMARHLLSIHITLNARQTLVNVFRCVRKNSARLFLTAVEPWAGAIARPWMIR